MRKSRDGREISAEDYSEEMGREGEREQMVYRVGGKSGDRATPRHAGKIGVPQMRLNGGDATAPRLLHFLLPRTLPRCWRLER